MKIYAVIGAGGFGREVMPLVQAQLASLEAKSYQLVFVSEAKATSELVNGYELWTLDQLIASQAQVKYFNVAIAQHAIRKRLAETLEAAGVQPFTIKAANHLELGPNSLGEGAILCPFTTITANATIGKHFHANLYSYVAHDCQIGDYVTFAPQVQCNGNVIIEDEVYVGTGVIIREGTPARPMVIGRGAVLGMGAVVTKSVPPMTTVVGNPAQPLRPKVATA